MAENLKCSQCSNAATVHLTQIVNSKIIKVDLCESCAQSKGVTDSEGFALAELISNTKQPGEPVGGQVGLKCDTCGLTDLSFQKKGRLGCSECYEVFGDALIPLLEDMHVGTAHDGKIPETLLNRLHEENERKALERAMKTAIESEEYEDAARLRDELRVLADKTAAQESGGSE